jgi:hypothetical protein
MHRHCKKPHLTYSQNLHQYATAQEKQKPEYENIAFSDVAARYD